MDFAQHVKSSVDIVSVVREYVRLRKQGPNRWVGLCPFHTEKTPSFNVNEGLQIFKCFGCGKGGDVFTFVMEMQGLTFYEALKSLAELHGIPLPKRDRGDLDPDARLRAALYQIHELAQATFRKQLQSKDGASARAYLEAREISEEVAEEFGLGYAAASGSRLLDALRREGFTAEQIEASGLASRRQDGSGLYDPFRGRLTFPIANETGRVIAFGARALQPEQQPKYLNSKNTGIYDKKAVLYNLHRAKQAMRKDNRAVLVEGYMDVIGVARAGVPGVVACCGTAFKQQQARIIKRHAEVVVVNFDSDRAGQHAAETSIKDMLLEGLKVRILALPGELDPDDFCKQQGPEAYQRLLDQAPDYYFWLADQARRHFDMQTSEGSVAAFKFLMPYINLLPDKIQRASLADELAQYLRVDRGLVLERFRREVVERRPTPQVGAAPDVLSTGEKLLLRLLVESQQARAEMLASVVEITTAASLPCSSIVEAIAAVQAAGDAFHYTALEGRLEEKDRGLLSAILFDRDAPGCSLEEGRQALAALQRQIWGKQYRAVRRQVVEAEKSGDRDQALRLVQAKIELARKLGLLEKAAKA